MSWLNKAKNVANQAREKIDEADTKALIQKAKASSSDTVSSLSKYSTKL